MIFNEAGTEKFEISPNKHASTKTKSYNRELINQMANDGGYAL